MQDKIKKADSLASELAGMFNQFVQETEDFDLRRLFKQLEADLMDIRHKLSLALKITRNGTR